MQPVNQMIQEAITKTLVARGMIRTEAGGDLTVAYLVVIGNNVTTEMMDDYFGYGSDASALLNKASSAYTESSHMNYFEAGTLLIDIVDARTHKLLLRNYASRQLLRNPSDTAREALIQETVDAILTDLRVAAP
jgi:predicted Zn-dependent protease